MFSDDITDISSFSEKELSTMYVFLKWINIVKELWKDNIKEFNNEWENIYVIEEKIKNELLKKQLHKNWLENESNKLSDMESIYNLDLYINWK